MPHVDPNHMLLLLRSTWRIADNRACFPYLSSPRHLRHQVGCLRATCFPSCSCSSRGMMRCPQQLGLAQNISYLQASIGDYIDSVQLAPAGCFILMYSALNVLASVTYRLMCCAIHDNRRSVHLVSPRLQPRTIALVTNVTQSLASEILISTWQCAEVSSAAVGRQRGSVPSGGRGLVGRCRRRGRGRRGRAVHRAPRLSHCFPCRHVVFRAMEALDFKHCRRAPLRTSCGVAHEAASPEIRSRL